MSAPAGYSMASTSPVQTAPGSSEGMSAEQSSTNSATWSFEEVTSHTDSAYHSNHHLPSQYAFEIPTSEPRRIPTEDDERSPCRRCCISDGEMLNQIPGILANKNNAEVYGIEPGHMKKKMGKKQLHFEHRQWLCKNKDCGYTWYTYSYWFGKVNGEMIMRYTRREDEFFNQLRSWAQNLNPFRFIDKLPSKRSPTSIAQSSQPPVVRTPQYVQCSDLQLRESRRPSYNDLENSQLTIVPRPNEATGSPLSSAGLDQFLSEASTSEQGGSIPGDVGVSHSVEPWSRPMYSNPEQTDPIQFSDSSSNFPSETMLPPTSQRLQPTSYLPSNTNQRHFQQHISSIMRRPTASNPSTQALTNAFSQSVPNLPFTAHAPGDAAVNPTAMLISRLPNHQILEQPHKRKLDYDVFHENRRRGACNECRAKKRKCPPEHPKQDNLSELSQADGCTDLDD